MCLISPYLYSIGVKCIAIFIIKILWKTMTGGRDVDYIFKIYFGFVLRNNVYDLSGKGLIAPINN